MYMLVFSWLMVAVTTAAPEYGFHGFGAPLYPEPIIKSAPVIPAPAFIKSIPAPIYSPPIFKAPVFAAPPPPIFAHAPIIKAPVPIVKTIVPATSYATVTQFHVAHPAPVIKTFVAPQPVLKTFAVPAPISYGHGFPSYH